MALRFAVLPRKVKKPHIILSEKPVLMSYALALALKGSKTFRCPLKLLILLPKWLVSKASQTALKTDANLVER